ncbi:MAG: hypothetical protein HOE76_06435 [Euryarchaeota archaeon]|jgi:hypothetical protein|nr:hypothetical protein [Euryarchaeota archaeon]MBT4982430.1 hypothetical protein [Euryarchaeota archaeon]MBT5183751.1 hypothetical protein [Euryarchaeota archaeon]
MNAKQLYIASLLSFIAIAIAYGPIPQPQEYHDFADDREFWSIPNTFDVMSNLVIIFPGIVGLAFVHERRGSSDIPVDETSIHITLFAGMILTFAGSVWFHLDPNDSTMFWDRLGMSVVIGSCISLIINDMLDRNLAAKIHIPILLASIISVIWWPVFDDLRIYFIVKHQPFIIFPILLLFGTRLYNKISGYYWGLSMFALATLFEFTDQLIFNLTGFISGHTLKHISAGIGLWFLMVMVRDRQKIPFEEE